MSPRFPLERKFRIDAILQERWRSTLPPRLGDALIRAMMNKLVEEAEHGGEELLHHIINGNFSLLRGAKLRGRRPDRVLDRSPTTGRFTYKEDDAPYHNR